MALAFSSTEGKFMKTSAPRSAVRHPRLDPIDKSPRRDLKPIRRARNRAEARRRSAPLYPVHALRDARPDKRGARRDFEKASAPLVKTSPRVLELTELREIISRDGEFAAEALYSDNAADAPSESHPSANPEATVVDEGS